MWSVTWRRGVWAVRCHCRCVCYSCFCCACNCCSRSGRRPHSCPRRRRCSSIVVHPTTPKLNPKTLSYQTRNKALNPNVVNVRAFARGSQARLRPRLPEEVFQHFSVESTGGEKMQHLLIMLEVCCGAQETSRSVPRFCRACRVI